MKFEDRCNEILTEAYGLKDPKQWKVAKDMGSTVKTWMIEAGVFDNEAFKDQVQDELVNVLNFLKKNK